jgi:hypothetical protein
MELQMSPTRSRLPRLLVLPLAFAVVVGACSVPGNPVGSPVAATPPASPIASGPEASASSEGAAASSDAWLVVGERGQAGLEVVLASTRERFVSLPMGVPGDQWGQVVTATAHGDSTSLDEIVVQPDLPTWRSRSIEGSWRLPTIGQDPLPVGMSDDGSTVVLVEADNGEGSSTRFAVLADDDPARVVELPGPFEYDTLAPDGSILYVIEHLPAPPEARYQVRAVDVATGVMRDAIIVDKRNLDAVMGGWPITQERHENGVVFTLYQGTGHPFIHALQSKEAWAVCLGLPTVGQEDREAALDWGIGQRADGRAVFAVNATLGLAVSIDPGDLSIRRSAAFDMPRAAATIELAKFGHQDAGPVGRRVVVSPDGATLFAAGATGIVRLETERLTTTGRLLEGSAVEALALTLDGSTLFALAHDGRILRLDAQTGLVLGQVPGEDYDRLVAIVPW